MKKLLKWLLVSTMTLSTFHVSVKVDAATDLSAQLKAHYTFDADTATTIDNVASNETTYNGTLNGSGVSLVSAASGKALKFDASLDSYMEVANMMNTATDSFTISMWYNYDSTLKNDNKNTVLLQQNGSGRTFLFLTPSGQLGSYVNAQNVYADTAVANDKWQHVALAYNHESKELTFYVNGVKDATKAAGANVVNATTSLLIGRHKNGGSDPKSMKGMVDEIRFYNEVIDAEKAAAIYADKKEVFQPTVTPEPSNLPTININGNNVIQTIDSSIFGINHRYAFNGYGTYDEENQVMKEDFAKLYRAADFGSIRYPGGTISNLFNWKTTLGPQETRKDQIHGFYNYAGQGGIAANFGLGEIATFAQENGSEIVYVYSIGRGNGKDAADLIEYLNAEVGTNPNGGIDWAQVRADNGHEEPYNVRYFEIGNEMQQGGGDGNGSQQYWLPHAGNAEDAYISGGLATFSGQYAVNEEDWNVTESYSKGTPNQEWFMRYANVENEDDENFIAFVDGSVKVYVNNEQWSIVDDLSTASATDKVCHVNKRNGKITFGDGVHGMIPPKGQQVKVDYKVQRDGFVQISRAMRETMDAINQAEGSNDKVYVYSSYETNGFINKMHNLGYDSLYDGLTIHPYSGTPSGGSSSEASKLTFYNDAINRANNKINDVKNYVNNMRQYDNTKVPVISEFGIFRSTDPLVRAQAHALYIARSIMGYVEAGSPYIQKHCLIDWYSAGADALGPTQQAVIQAVAQENADTKTGTGDFEFFSTPSANIFEVYNTAFDGTKVLETSVANAPVNNLNTATLYAMTAKDDLNNLYVALVNYAGQDVEVKIAANGYNTASANVMAYTTASDTFDAENTLEDPDNVVMKYESGNLSANSTYTLKPYSFTVLKVYISDVLGNKASDYIEELRKIDTSGYTTHTVQSFNNSLDHVETVLNTPGITAQTIDELYLSLRDVREMLEPVALTKALENVMKEAQAALEDADLYTEESVSELESVLEYAQDVVENKASTSQDTVDDVRISLQNALKALDLINGDTSALDALLEEAVQLYATDYVFTQESYADLEDAIEAVDAFYEGDDFRQSNIDTMYNMLKEVMDNLEYRPLLNENLINKAANSAVKVVTSSSGYPGETADKTLDYNTGSIWHSDWSNSDITLPQSITYDLGEEYALTDITFLPRSNGYNGDIFEMEVYVGDDVNDLHFMQRFNFDNDGAKLLNRTDFIRAAFAPNNTRYVKVVVTKSGADSQLNKFASLAEIRFYGTEPIAEPETPAVNTEEFDKVVREAEVLVYSGEYTNETTEALLVIVSEAKVLFEVSSPTQADVDAMVERLKAGIAGLVKKVVAPTKVENVVAEDTNYKTITLTWDASETATAYDVYRKAYDSEEFKLYKTVEDTTVAVTGVMTGKEYAFYVVAKNEVGEAEASATVVKATTLHGKVTLDIDQVSTSTFKLSWNKIDGATRYIVYRKRNDDKMKKVLTLGADKLEYTTAEMPNGEYEFQVRAGRYDSKDRVMTGASNKETVTVEKVAPAVTLKAGTKSVTVSWKAMEGVTHYQVYRATSKDGKYTKLTTTKELSYKAKSLSSGKKYFFKVRGYKLYKSGDDIKYNVYTPYSTVKYATAK